MIENITELKLSSFPVVAINDASQWPFFIVIYTVIVINKLKSHDVFVPGKGKRDFTQ